MEQFLNKVIHGNCVDIMKKMPDNCIDLTVTSPPYDNLRTYNGYTFDFESIAQELYRITKNGGIVVWVVGDATIKGSETGTSFKQALYFKEVANFHLLDTMIYEKDGVGARGSNYCYWQVYEFMFVFCKGKKPNNVNRIRDIPNKYAGQKPYGKITRRNKNGEYVENKNFIVSEYGIRTNIWRYKTGGIGKSTKDKIAFQHPAIFPEQLAHDHIISWSNENDIVLDPMCGSGTTCKMAKSLNRNYIGIDISEEYCNISKERVNLVK